MTLESMIEQIHTTPTDDSSPLLIVREIDLDEFDIDTITSAPYNRAPYVITEGITRARDLTYHNHTQREMTGLIDINVLQLEEAAKPARGLDIAAVAAAIIARLPLVNEITDGYPLISPLKLETETDPFPLQIGRRTNWGATLRVAYRIQR